MNNSVYMSSFNVALHTYSQRGGGGCASGPRKDSSQKTLRRRGIPKSWAGDNMTGVSNRRLGRVSLHCQCAG